MSELRQFPRRELPDALEVGTWTASDGWKLRDFAITTAGESRGSLLFLGGRADFFEKYLEAIQHWSAGGWNVAGFDWRGQGGSGVTHPDAHCHIDDFAIWVRDLAAYFNEWIEQSRGPHAVIGHSLGGHLVLRAVAEGRIEPDGIILSAPMLGIKAGPIRGRTLHALGMAGHLPMFRERAIWGKQTPAPSTYITTCSQRHEDKLWWKAQRPELARGGPTWGWLAEALRSQARLKRNMVRKPMETPALVLISPCDAVVDNRSITDLLVHMPKGQLHEIVGAGHELLRESDLPRSLTMDKIDAFLRNLQV